MRTTKTNDLADRRTAAVSAKAALLQAYRSRMEAAEPSRAARQQEQVALAAARDSRREERERLKAEAEHEAKAAAEATAALEAAAVAEKAGTDARQKTDSLIARVVRDDAARKAERDRRYANRKARQR